MWEGLPMLLWQPQNFLRIRSVFFVSLALHVVVCFSLLFVYKDYHQRLCIDLSSRIPSQAIVKLLPLSASRSALQTIGVKGGKKGPGSFKTVMRSQKKKKSPTSLAKQSVVSKSVKASKGKKGAETKKTAVKALAEKKTKEAQQRTLELEKKKKAEELQQKVESEKALEKEMKQREETKKEEVKLGESLKKKEEENVLASSSDQQRTGESTGSEGQEILYLTKQEFDALHIQQKLQECLFDLWTPPAGIPSGTVCEVLVTVGWDGVILETEFLRKSDILMYDLSVQETFEQVTFPHEVWGKQITIAFKP